jgi:hypothetical protein
MDKFNWKAGHVTLSRLRENSLTMRRSVQNRSTVLPLSLKRLERKGIEAQAKPYEQRR